MGNGDFSSELVIRLTEEAGFQIVEQVDLPGRPGRLVPIPSGVHEHVRDYLVNAYPNGLYYHQAVAIEQSLSENDVCLATATASGKSLVFMVVAVDLILREPSARILALYPAKALIQDQLARWSAFLNMRSKVGCITGDVPIDRRLEILNKSRIVLMTPDVVHAWLLREAGNSDVGRFLDSIRLLVLDEAHVYEGAFGTNMAYMLRRLEGVSANTYRIIASTATLGDPQDFIYKLTGRSAICYTENEDGSHVPPKTILLSQPAGFTETTKLLNSLANKGKNPFLAFADSRKQVERFVSAVQRQSKRGDDEAGINAVDIEEIDEKDRDGLSELVLPYRAGYEDEDRLRIQKALEQGELAGVVCTSALELGLDIGEIGLVILLTTPPSVKAFKQRIGRGGRRRPGICLILDTAGTITMTGLNNYLRRSNEPNWLYLENRYIQYINVLCAAAEISQRGEHFAHSKTFSTLPPKFKTLLDNELHPSEPVPDDLFRLKQQGEASPHLEFPLRSGVEKQFRVWHRGPGHESLGTLTFSQVLREAYPGGIYYYMARPYRVRQLKYRSGEIIVARERYWTTDPVSQTMVFPNFQAGLLQLWTVPSGDGFVAETTLQVSERVLGFKEKRGSADPEMHTYAPGSRYYQRPLNNFFETTGVCWYFPEIARLDDEALLFFKDVFCKESGILDRDVGSGFYASRTSPVVSDKITDWCIYDGAPGSQRMTQVLADNFSEVAQIAADLAATMDDIPERVQQSLAMLAKASKSLTLRRLEEVAAPGTLLGDLEEDWTTVVKPGEKATVVLDSPREVIVLDYRYTPKGLMYDLEHPDYRWSVPAEAVRPIYGVTQMLSVNLVTGETRPFGYFQDVSD